MNYYLINVLKYYSNKVKLDLFYIFIHRAREIFSL